MPVKIVSFGFKHGIPAAANFVFDVRFLRNPHRLGNLRCLDGRMLQVREDVFSGHGIDQLYLLSTFLNKFIPVYLSLRKVSLVIAVGCTGGHHRSVAVAEYWARSFGEHLGEKVIVEHRELIREGRLNDVGN